MRCLVQLLLVTLLVPSMYCSRLVLAAPRVSGWARSCVLNLAHSLQCTKWTIVRPSVSLVLIPKWSTKFRPHPLKVFNSTELPFPRDIFADTVPVMRNHAPVFTKLLLVNLRMIQGTVLSQLLLYIVPQLLIKRDVQGMIVKQSTHNTVWPHSPGVCGGERSLASDGKAWFRCYCRCLVTWRLHRCGWGGVD